jgi:hypothetical protein
MTYHHLIQLLFTNIDENIGQQNFSMTFAINNAQSYPKLPLALGRPQILL